MQIILSGKMVAANNMLRIDRAEQNSMRQFLCIYNIIRCFHLELYRAFSILFPIGFYLAVLDIAASIPYIRISGWKKGHVHFDYCDGIKGSQFVSLLLYIQFIAYSLLQTFAYVANAFFFASRQSKSGAQYIQYGKLPLFSNESILLGIFTKNTSAVQAWCE